MQKINYRFTFILIYISFILFSLLLLKYIFEQNSLKNIDEISKDNIEIKVEGNTKTIDEIKIVSKTKLLELIKQNQDNQNNIYFIIILISFIFLPVVFYFAKIPESLKDKIYEQTVTDQLTNLPNKQHLLKDLNQHKFLDAAIILVNIDNFDKIQTAYGYKISENLIIEISKYLNEYSKTHKNFIKLYKVSKNSFALKYEVISKSNFIAIIENLHKDIENNIFEPDKNFEILANCTIASSDPVNLNNDLNELKEAELALSSALENSKEINIYDNDDFNKIEKNKKNIDMVNKIKKAIDTNNVIVQFQAIYNNYHEKTDKYETLIRLKTRDGKIVYPGEFLDIAKDIKKYKKLTMIVIEKSFEYFKDKDYEFSINLSIEDIASKEIREFLYKKIAQYSVNDKLVLEIVESEAIENYDDFIDFIKAAKKLGCKIAIDDFGSGYSNYSYIVKFSDYIDYLKIDGSLILGLHENPKRQLLVGTLKFLCDNLDIKTVAEFVESKELFEYVKSMGINYSQGFYISKPQDEI
ncbi:MAG: EAL domain-containing protein [Campylobacterota bacterium]